MVHISHHYLLSAFGQILTQYQLTLVRIQLVTKPIQPRISEEGSFDVWFVSQASSFPSMSHRLSLLFSSGSLYYRGALRGYRGSPGGETEAEFHTSWCIRVVSVLEVACPIRIMASLPLY